MIVTDEELEAIEPLAGIDPKFFDSAYFLAPSGGSNKAYRLLAHVMEKGGRAGLATFVMRAREYAVAIIAENGILVVRVPEEAAAEEEGGEVIDLMAALRKSLGGQTGRRPAKRGPAKARTRKAK